MKKIFSKVPTFVLGAFVGVALTSATVVGAASYLKATVYNVNIVVDGKEAKLSDKPLNVNGKTYLPVRDTASALGYGVASVSSSKIELKSGATPSTGTSTSTPNNSTDNQTVNQTGNNNNTSKPNNSKGVYVKNLKETYSTDGKLDATKIREALNSGALDVNSQDEETGNTLLHYVILENNYEAYKAINRNALNVDIQNKNGETPLHTSVIEENDFYFGELINDKRADAKIKDKKGLLPIDHAEKNSSFQLFLKGYMM
ncbi:stalk domain-containing protein [Paenibacillus lautus]|uniref:stalk domain-containing protein n=1 Tax=Paenibacillus lautus TaxID=1401 RepID=UPI00203C436C|nr:stalk domain-containing protein [Paenibacillus lautus]MCM3256982.1 stalk domain-containing protein [Paenibacillus lautus]